MLANLQIDAASIYRCMCIYPLMHVHLFINAASIHKNNMGLGGRAAGTYVQLYSVGRLLEIVSVTGVRITKLFINHRRSASAPVGLG